MTGAEGEFGPKAAPPPTSDAQGPSSIVSPVFLNKWILLTPDSHKTLLGFS